MIRLSALLWLMLVVAAGFVTFKVKYAVQDIEDELSRARKQTIAEQQEIRVLSAEWTYLNQPERLAELNRRFLQLAPIGAKQLQHKIEDIPLRPLPPPSAPPDILVAATTDPPATQAPAPVPSSNEAGPVPAASVAPSGGSGLAALAIAQASASELPVAALKPASSSSVPKVQLAKARPMSTPNSLDELFSQVAETR
jgi:cell division protein FtsL